MTKYVIMFETDKEPDPGNCDACELICPYYMSAMDKLMLSNRRNYIRNINDYYCPIKAFVDVETFMKWKEEHPDLGEPKRLEVNNE